MDICGWVPLNTDAIDLAFAPWDGEPVMIATDHRGFNRVHRCIWSDAPWGEGIFGWCVEDCKHGPYPLRGFQKVTHWMPVPPPPN